MDDERPETPRPLFKAADGILLATLAFITIMAIVFNHRVEGWKVLTLKNLGAGAAYLAAVALSRRSSEPIRRFFFRLAGVLFLFSYINLAMAKLQLVIYGRWLDDGVLRLESALLGVQPTIWLQKFISVPLTEWMFFCYASYLVIYPALGVFIFFRRGEEAAEDYLFTLSISNVVCDLGFLLYPVAGPMAHMGGQYTVPLAGHYWAQVGEYIRSHWQFVGGNIPSPHCANATVMWLMAYRYHRPTFWTLSPIILTLYVSTVYCRYHYLTDSVTGVAVALLAWAVAPAVREAWDRIVERWQMRTREARA